MNSAGDKNIKKKSAITGWKLAGMGIIIIAISAFVAFEVINLVSKHLSDKYEKTLSEYYHFISRGETNEVQKLTANGFLNELGSLKLKFGKYILYSYQFELLNPTNQTDPYSKILYSVSLTEDNSKVSYLCEAFFILENDNAELKLIKKLYKGKNITKY